MLITTPVTQLLGTNIPYPDHTHVAGEHAYGDVLPGSGDCDSRAVLMGPAWGLAKQRACTLVAGTYTVILLAFQSRT